MALSRSQGPEGDHKSNMKDIHCWLVVSIIATVVRTRFKRDVTVSYL